MDRTGTGWRDPEPPKGPDRLFAFAGRHRGASIAAAIALAVLAGTALQLVSLAARFVEGPSAEAAIADADKTSRRELSYTLVSERTEPDGRVGGLPARIRLGARCREGDALRVQVAPGSLVVVIRRPRLHRPRPRAHYELANKDEWRQSYIEWNREQMRREGRDWLSLHPQGGQGTDATEGGEASAEEGAQG